MEKVLTTTEFVLWQAQFMIDKHDANKHGAPQEATANFWEMIVKYATLMQQPLELGMFVPCDDNLTIINKPTRERVFASNGDESAYQYLLKEYEGEIGKILFSGWRLFQKNRWFIIITNTHDEQLEFHISSNECIGGSPIVLSKNIEEMARQIEATPTKAFMERIGL